MFAAGSNVEVAHSLLQRVTVVVVGAGHRSIVDQDVIVMVFIVSLYADTVGAVNN